MKKRPLRIQRSFINGSTKNFGFVKLKSTYVNHHRIYCCLLITNVHNKLLKSGNKINCFICYGT